MWILALVTMSSKEYFSDPQTLAEQLGRRRDSSAPCGATRGLSLRCGSSFQSSGLSGRSSIPETDRLGIIGADVMAVSKTQAVSRNLAGHRRDGIAATQTPGPSLCIGPTLVLNYAFWPIREGFSRFPPGPVVNLLAREESPSLMLAASLCGGPIGSSLEREQTVD